MPTFNPPEKENSGFGDSPYFPTAQQISNLYLKQDLVLLWVQSPHRQTINSAWNIIKSLNIKTKE